MPRQVDRGGHIGDYRFVRRKLSPLRNQILTPKFHPTNTAQFSTASNHARAIQFSEGFFWGLSSEGLVGSAVERGGDRGEVLDQAVRPSMRGGSWACQRRGDLEPLELQGRHASLPWAESALQIHHKSHGAPRCSVPPIGERLCPLARLRSNGCLCSNSGCEG